MIIRPAVPADAPAVRDCAVAAFSRYVPAIGCAPAPMLADHAALIAAGQVHVAVDDAGAVMGYVAFHEGDDHMVLDAVAVADHAAGRGIGRALIARCEDAARGAGLAQVRLSTNRAMTDNLRIYPHLGYAEVGRGVEDGYDRVFFAKALGTPGQ